MEDEEEGEVGFIVGWLKEWFEICDINTHTETETETQRHTHRHHNNVSASGGLLRRGLLGRAGRGIPLAGGELMLRWWGK